MADNEKTRFREIKEREKENGFCWRIFSGHEMPLRINTCQNGRPLLTEIGSAPLLDSECAFPGQNFASVVCRWDRAAPTSHSAAGYELSCNANHAAAERLKKRVRQKCCRTIEEFWIARDNLPSWINSNFTDEGLIFEVLTKVGLNILTNICWDRFSVLHLNFANVQRILQNFTTWDSAKCPHNRASRIYSWVTKHCQGPGHS